MPHPGTNERKYPHIVELAVGEDGLDVGLGRRIMAFHNSRHIKPRHGHIDAPDRSRLMVVGLFPKASRKANGNS